MPRAASSIFGGTDSRPVSVLRRMGKIAHRVRAVMVGALPSPRGGMSRPNRANEGMVSIVPVTASASRLAVEWPSMATPHRQPDDGRDADRDEDHLGVLDDQGDDV